MSLKKSQDYSTVPNTIELDRGHTWTKAWWCRWITEVANAKIGDELSSTEMSNKELRNQLFKQQMHLFYYYLTPSVLSLSLSPQWRTWWASSPGTWRPCRSSDAASPWRWRSTAWASTATPSHGRPPSPSWAWPLRRWILLIVRWGHFNLRLSIELFSLGLGF